jgi:DNA-binding LytR/AlgR family response regulator
MQGINILVVEDESIVAKDIQQSLKKLGYNVVGVSSTAEQAIEKATELKPELVLMDIMLKGELSGIDAAMEIRSKLDIPVVFLTAYADSATLNKAKETEPFGYIIKPFKEIDLHTSIEMALYKHKKESQVRKERDFLYSIIENMEGNGIIFIKSNSKLVKLKTSDIFFIEALKDYVTINTKTARYTIHSTMKDIQAKLPQNEFIRVHRSFIVRVDKIGSIDFPIGGSYKEELYQKLKLI